ncbi:MAG: DUF4091 domain-containing protein [bacterium]|nr:DUF4091 domain-containing protein [bacterium]
MDTRKFWYYFYVVLFFCVYFNRSITVAEPYDKYGLVPLITIGRTSNPIVLDGDLRDWQETFSVSGFTRNDGTGYASQQTRVYMTYDMHSMYIAYRCYEADMVNQRITESRHDGLPWRDDSIELLILSDNNWDKLAHIIVNAGGALYDAIGLDPENAEWESRTQVAVGKDDSSWIVELAIPFTALCGQRALVPTMTNWKINFYRNRYRETAEYSSWSYCPGPFKNPIRLGILKFQELVPKLELPNQLELGFGYNELPYTFIPPEIIRNSSYRLHVEALVRTDNTTLADIPLSTIGTTQHCISFPLYGYEDGIQVMLFDQKNEAVYRTVFPLMLKPESIAGELRLQTMFLRQLLQNPNIPAGIHTELQYAVHEVVTVTDELEQKSASAYQQKKRISHSDWVEISQKMNELYRKLSNYQTIVWKKGIWENLFPDELPYSTEEIKEIDLLAMQDEYISAAFNITNLSFLPYQARVCLRELVSKIDEGKSEKFPMENITFRRVVYRQLKNGMTVGDALPAMDEAHFIDIPSLKSGQVWISIKTHNIPPGKYFGQIVLKPLEDRMFSQKTVQITIKVLPITLPREMPIATYLWDYAENDAYIRDLIDHKINKMLVPCYLCPPICDSTGNVISIDFSKHDTAIAMKHKYGNEIIFSYGVVREFDRWAAKKYHWEYMSDPWKKAFGTWLKSWITHLLDLGLDYTDFSMQIWDEATGDLAKKVAEVGPFLRNIDPRVRWVMNGAQNLEEAKLMNPYVDIWIPHLDSLLKSSEKDSLLAYYKSTGKPIWSYTCRVNMTSQPVLEYYRLKPWLVYQLGLDGVCFWAYNSWRGDPWSDFDVVGDEGYSDNGVVYSSDRGPIPSRRWEAFREGLQDYQYLFILEQLIKQAEAEGTAQENDMLVKLAREAKGILQQAVNEVLLTKDESVVYLWRERIAEMILKLKKS